jgi:hypothetical protein
LKFAWDKLAASEQWRNKADSEEETIQAFSKVLSRPLSLRYWKGTAVLWFTLRESIEEVYDTYFYDDSITPIQVGGLSAELTQKGLELSNWVVTLH